MNNFIVCPIAIERECRIKPILFSEMRASSTIDIHNEICSILKDIEALKNEIISFLESDTINDKIHDKGLINFKRDIYNDRYSKILKFNAESIENAVLKSKVTKLFDLIKHIREKESLMEAMWKRDYLNSVEIIRNAIKNEPLFYDSIKHISFSMYDKLHKYCGLSAAEHKSTQRKGNIPFVKLLTRSALKPSPFANFVSVKPIILTNEDCQSSSEDSLYISNLYINEVILLRAYSGFLGLSEIIERSTFSLNDKVFAGSGFYDIAYEKDNLNNNKVFNTKAAFSHIPMTENINKLYNYCINNSEVDFSVIRMILGYNDNNTILFIINAINAGLIHNTKMVYSNSIDTFGDIIYNIDNYFFDLEKAIEFKEILLNIKGLIRRYNQLSNDIKSRIRLFSEITENAKKLYALVGITESPANILYEDLVDKKPKKKFISVERLDNISKLCRLSNIFDINYRIQLYFAERFKQKFGDNEITYDNVHLMLLMTECNQRFGDMWVHEWDTGLSRGLCESIDRLDDMKDRFHKYLTNRKDDDFIEIDDELLDSLLQPIQDIAGERHFSNDIFYQELNNGRIVINNLYPGYMTFFGRHIDYFTDPEFIKYKKEYLRIVASKENISEIYEVYGFNANRHNPIFDSVIAFDDDREKYRRFNFKNIINKSNVTLKYNHKTRIVDFFEDGKKVNFKEIGSLVTFLMKGEHSFVHNLCTNVLTYPQMYKAFELKHDFITRIPEISYKDIIISRKSYILNTRIIPVYDKTISEVENFFNLRKWFKDNCLPMQFFVKRYLDSSESIDASKQKIDYSVNKPQFIDLENIILYQLFEKIRSNDFVCIISECQPYYLDNADENIREYILEVTQ